MRAGAAALLAVAACGGASASRNPAPPKTPFSPAQIAELALPSVVLIKTENMLGTGFVVWKDGRIATNLHVIAGSQSATVTLSDRREFKDVEVLAADPEHDLAVIRIGTTDLKPLLLGDSGAVKPGEHVVTIGHPLGLGNTVSDGLISGVRPVNDKLTLLQMTAPIAPGSSGGPIFNERGEVIGVATRYAAEGQNVNFGVPISYLRPMLLNEHALPLAVFQQELDLGLLEGCSIDEVKLAVNAISDAIKVGVPKYNKGDPQGCFDLYQQAALKLVGELKGCPGVRETLLSGLTQANTLDDPGKKAWAIRHAFDRIMAGFDAALKKVEEQHN